MNTIKLYLGVEEVAPLRLCDHLALKYDDPISVPGEETLSLRNVKCPNCGGWMCERCQDDAVRCAGGLCVGRICAECQATARKRDIIIEDKIDDRGQHCPTRTHSDGKCCPPCDHMVSKECCHHIDTDYLCAPCCARQDEQIAILLTAIRAIYQKVGMAYVSVSSGWLDEILEALDSAIGKAREAL